MAINEDTRVDADDECLKFMANATGELQLCSCVLVDGKYQFCKSCLRDIR